MEVRRHPEAHRGHLPGVGEAHRHGGCSQKNKVQGLGLRVPKFTGSGVEGLGFRVQGLGSTI